MTIFRAFKRDENGAMAIELLLVVPILLWALLSTFVYFDAFRTKANALRASLTVADMFSREQEPIDIDLMVGAQELLQTLTLTDMDPELRASVFTFDDPDGDGIGQFQLVWSRHRGMDRDLRNEDFVQFQADDRLPIMSHEDRAFLIETRSEYSAPFAIGISAFSSSDLDVVELATFDVIRPRFISEPCYDPTRGIPGDEIC